MDVVTRGVSTWTLGGALVVATEVPAMRYLAFFLVGLLFCGCGGSSETSPILNQGGPTFPPLVITLENAVHIHEDIDELSVPSGRNSVELAGGDLSRIEIDGVAAVLVEMPLAYFILSQGTSQTFPGPGGGSAQLVVDPETITVNFLQFVTQDGTRLNGTAVMRGEVEDVVNHIGDISATFTALEVADSDGVFQIDGPVTLGIHRTLTAQGYVERIERTQNATIRDLTNGGSVRFINGDTIATITVENDRQSGSAVTSGSFLFDNYDGLSGLLTRGPLEDYLFSVDHTTHISTVTSGQSLLEGDGTIRLTVVAPDMIETAVRPSGGSEFVVVEVKDITDVDAD